jgi:hypothetical protein
MTIATGMQVDPISPRLVSGLVRVDLDDAYDDITPRSDRCSARRNIGLLGDALLRQPAAGEQLVGLRRAADPAPRLTVVVLRRDGALDRAKS